LRQLYDANNQPTVVVRQELIAIGLGPKNWAEYEKNTAKPAKIWIEAIDIEQILDYQTPDDLVLIGDSHFVRGDAVVIAGVGGVGKSRALTSLAISGATSRPWFGLNIHCKFRTLCIQAENSRKRLQDEFNEIINHLQTEIPDLRALL